MGSLRVLASGLVALLGVTATTVSAQAAGAAERFVLSGVIVFDDGEGIAWLQEPSLTQNQVVTRRQGDSVGPWRLTRILENRVELEGPGGTVVIPLYNTGGVGKTPATAVTAPGTPVPSAPVAPATVPPSTERLTEGAPAEAARDPAIERADRGRGRAAREGRGAGQRAVSPERPQRDERGRMESSPPSVAAPAPSGGSSVISIPTGDPRRLGGLGSLFGAQK